MKILRIWSLIKRVQFYTLVQITKGRARFVEVNPYNAELLETFIPKIKDLLANL